MDTRKINAGIDSAATQTKETIELLNEKLDQATHCASTTKANIKNSAKARVIQATDIIEEAVTTAAERVKEKMRP